MTKFKSIFFLFLTVLLFACGEEKDGGSSMNDYLASFLYGDNAMVAYGSSDLNDIIGKSDIQSIPMIGGTVRDVQALMAPNSKVYYALEGPLNKDGMPVRSYLFVDVRNADSLLQSFEGMGYMFSTKDGIHISAQDDKVIGIKNDLAIGILSEEKITEGELLMVAAFEKASGSNKSKQAEEILNDDADIVVGSNLNALYETSNTDLDKLTTNQKLKIKEYVEGSQYKTTVRFENGEAIIAVKAMVNDKLRDALFLKAMDNTDVLAKLGPGAPKAAFAINLDLDKMQRLAEDFSPGIMEEIYGQLGVPTLLLAGLGPDGLVSIINGQFGVALTGTNSDGGEIPQLSAFLGLGKNASSLTEMGEGMLAMNGATEQNGVYSYEGTKLKLTKDFVMINTAGESVDETKMGYVPISLPTVAKNFGKKPITGFIDMTAMAGEANFMLEVGDFKQVVNIIDFIYFEADNLESKLVIKAKEGNENILKQVVTAYMDDLAKGF